MGRFHFYLIVLGNSVIGFNGLGKNIRLFVEPFVDDPLSLDRIVRPLK
jgi:hypothetical protein